MITRRCMAYSCYSWAQNNPLTAEEPTLILNACCSVTTVQTASSSKTICQRRLGFDAISLLADLLISFYTAFKVACDIRHGLPGVLIKQPTIKLTHEKKAVDNFRKRRGGICVFEQSWKLSQQRDFKFEEFENGDAKVHPHLGRAGAAVGMRRRQIVIKNIRNIFTKFWKIARNWCPSCNFSSISRAQIRTLFSWFWACLNKFHNILNRCPKLVPRISNLCPIHQ